MKRVLEVGLEPIHANLSQFPEFNAAMVTAYAIQQLDCVRDQGFEVVDCLITTGDAGLEQEEAALEAQEFDYVMTSAGLRGPPELLLLFEKVSNVAHRLAPKASICFNSSLADSADAVQRWIEP